MNEEYGVDLDEVFKVIDSSDVLVVRFHIIQPRLLVDFRTRTGVSPFMAVVPRAESVEDRFRAIKKLRPELPFPEKVMSFAWPRSMPVLLASGVWQRLVDRMAALGGPEAVERCGAVMQELQEAEREEVAAAIRGAQHYQTLWERPRP